MYTHVFLVSFRAGLVYTRGAHFSFPLHCRWWDRIERWDGMDGWVFGIEYFYFVIGERERENVCVEGSLSEEGRKKERLHSDWREVVI
jgi:hypothetical protein